MSVLFVKPAGIIALTPAASYLDKTGFFVSFTGDVASVCLDAAAVEPTGVIMEPNVTVAGYATEKLTVGLLGALKGTVRVKLGGAVTKGAKLKLNFNGTAIADAPGERWVIGTALETGIPDDLIEVGVHTARYYAS